MSDMDYLSATLYAEGCDGVQVATDRTVALLAAHASIRTNRDPSLPPLPAWQDMSVEALARKIVGHILDAGWCPPSDAEIAKIRGEAS